MANATIERFLNPEIPQGYSSDFNKNGRYKAARITIVHKTVGLCTRLCGAKRGRQERYGETNCIRCLALMDDPRFGSCHILSSWEL